MAEVLTQSEIDALLAAVGSGNVDTAGKAKANGDWIAYDLTSQEKIIRSRFAGFLGIHERFSRSLRVVLSNSFRKNIIVTPTSTDFMRFGDYISNMLTPTSFSLYSMKGLNGTMLFVSGAKLTYALVDSYYGGPERPFSKTGRESFTKIESKMIRKICDMASSALCKAWRTNYPLELDFVRSESNPHFVGSIHVSDLVAIVTFEIEFENLSGPLSLVIQLKALDPIQEHLKVNYSDEGAHGEVTWRAHWTRELLETLLDVRVELGYVGKKLSEVQCLKVGDVLVLNQDTVSPIPIYVSDQEKAAGLMGTFRGSRAVRITDLFSQGKPNSEGGSQNG